MLSFFEWARGLNIYDAFSLGRKRLGDPIALPGVKVGIKIKLALILSTLLFLTISLLGVVMIFHQRASLDTLMRSMAGTITGEFASNSKIPLMQKDGLAMNLLIQNMLKNPGITDAYILNHDFVIEGHKDLSEVGQEYYRSKEILKNTGPAPWVEESKGTTTFVTPIVFQSTTVGYAVVFFSNDFISERVRMAVTSFFMVAGFAIAVVALISIPLASGLLRPIFRLFKGTQEIALGNFDYRIPEKGEDEMGDLVRSFNRMASELKKKEVMKGVFNRYVSPHVADEILKEPDRISLGGDKREVTVFFADIRGFSALSRKMLPEGVVEVLNRYFTLITDITFRFEGTVDKFIGDAVMGVFGSPIRSEAHLEQGIKAAVAIKKSLIAINGARSSRGLVPFEIGVGLDSGTVIVGNMGSKARMEFTAVGDAVNMASRLADTARGGDIVISSEVYDRVRDNVIAISMPDVAIKGYDAPVTLYRLTDLKGKWKEDVERIVSDVVKQFEKEGLVQ